MAIKLAFKVVDANDRVLEGIINAPSLYVARRKLETEYARVLSLEEIEAVSAGTAIPTSGIRRADIAIYTRQLSVLLKAGISLPRALEVVARGECENLNIVFVGMVAEIDRGKSLSRAMRKFPTVFNALFVALIEAAEVSGNLEDNLGRLTDLLDKEVSLRRKVTSTFVYPGIVGVVSMMVLAVFVWFILPTMRPGFEEMGVKLPWLTRAMLLIGDVMSNPLHVLPVIAVCALLGWRFLSWVRTREGRVAVEARVRTVPLLGPTLEKQEVVSVLYILSTMLDAGVPLGSALHIAERASTSVGMSMGLFIAQKLMSEGMTFTDAARASAIFPGPVLKMVAVGEETGNVGHLMRCACRLYEEDIDRTLADLSTILEPLILVVVGVIVGIITLAAFLPSLSLLDSF